MDQVKYRAPLRAPFSACLWVTDYCNLSCKYCYAKPFSGKRMETKRLLRLIDELIEAEVFDLTLAGGEPLLHPDIIEVIERSLRGGIRVGVLTNGITLTREVHDHLESLSNGKNLILQISLDTTEESINDYTRGKTAVVLKNLDNIPSSKIDLQLATVVHKLNIHNAHEVIERFYPKIKRFHFLNIQQTEEALKYPELLTSCTEAQDFWLRLASYSKQFPSDLYLPSLRIQLRAMGSARVDPEFALHSKASFECASCSAGHSNVNITADFTVLGCDIAKDHTIMGNIRDKSFSEVWHSEKAHAVRTAKIPACYRIKNEKGESYLQSLKPEYQDYV